MNSNPLLAIVNDQEFEELCCNVAQHKFGDFNARKYGRSGQRQLGVDITATNRRENQEKIVIQCKFKSDPPKFTTRKKSEFKALRSELEEELKMAKSGHTFDQFIYASNVPRDKDLDKLEEEFSDEDHSVIIWTQIDLEEDIKRYKRLEQFYTVGGSKHGGVELINKDFVDTIKEEEEAINPNIFRFYASSEINNTQWYGIYKEWDVIRYNYAKIYESIKDSFSKTFIESRVAGLILGEGGAGKSIFLRRIAWNLCVNEENIVIWWVKNLRTFNNRDVISIEENAQYNHVVIVEDWYRNVGNDVVESSILFNWLKEKNNVRLLIGDRSLNKNYARHITERNKNEITTEENYDILVDIKKRFKQLDEKIGQLLENKSLLNQSPIFIILFVLSEMVETEIDVDYDKLNFENLFKELIGRKVKSLEDDSRYRGVGKALYVCSILYSDPDLNYYSTNRNLFFILAELLGDNLTIIDRFELIDEYPDALNGLVSFEKHRLKSLKSGVEYFAMFFNHDLIAEKGISMIADTKYDLGYNFDIFECNSLISKCLDRKQYNFALMLFLWLAKRSNKFTLDKFLEFFKENLQSISGLALTLYFNSLSKADKKILGKEILDDKNFLLLSPEITYHSLRIWQHDDYGRRKAKEILDNEDFLKLHFHLVVQSLMIWEKDDYGKDKAREILNNDEFLKLPQLMLSHSLKMLQEEDIGKNKAREILEDENFLSLSYELVSHALRIRQHDDFGRSKTKEILGTDNFYKLPSSIVSIALRVWVNDEFGKSKAMEILNHEKFLELPFEIVTHALRICKDEEIGKKKAKKILEQEEFYSLPDSIVSFALRICQEDEIGKIKAKEILQHEDFLNLAFEIICTALRIWQDEEFGKSKAREILYSKEWFKLPYQMLSQALRVSKDEEYGKVKAKEILNNYLNNNKLHNFVIFNSIKLLCLERGAELDGIIRRTYKYIASNREGSANGRFYYDLLYLPLFYVKEHRGRAEDLINNYSFASYWGYKQSLYNLLNCFKEYPKEYKKYFDIKSLLNAIMANWENDLSFQLAVSSFKLNDGHIALALSHNQTKKNSKKIARRVIKYSSSNAILQKRHLYQTAQAILEDDQFEFWG